MKQKPRIPDNIVDLWENSQSIEDLLSTHSLYCNSPKVYRKIGQKWITEAHDLAAMALYYDKNTQQQLSTTMELIEKIGKELKTSDTPWSEAVEIAYLLRKIHLLYGTRLPVRSWQASDVRNNRELRRSLLGE